MNSQTFTNPDNHTEIITLKVGDVVECYGWSGQWTVIELPQPGKLLGDFVNMQSHRGTGVLGIHTDLVAHEIKHAKENHGQIQS